jgi:gamma-glutamylcyclotransferase (GGCT)/AIG2-like uncharacterized protein YtfP
MNDKRSKYYFGYGSNLNSTDWARWCNERGFHDDCIRPVTTAQLHDFALVFDRYSHGWKGGALSLRPYLGSVVDGVVFEVNEQGQRALDGKEGAPNCYARMDAVVLDESGRNWPVFTYKVQPQQRDPRGFVEPTSEYLDVVTQGYKQWGFNTAPLESAAKDRPHRHAVSSIFVYGTLLRNEARAHILHQCGVKCVLLAETPGTLWDLGAYPALSLGEFNHQRLVSGEFVRVSNINKALRILDSVEGFSRVGDERNLYERRLITVGMCDGHMRRAWTYVWAGATTGLTAIPSGDWRHHLGRRDAFYSELIAAHSRGREREIAQFLANRHLFTAVEEVDSEAEKLLPLDVSLRKKAFSERELAQVTGKWAVMI